MAKFKNVFQEASRRYRDFKSRGFIPSGSKYAYQDFVNEVIAENHGKDYDGAYTASAYERAYGTNVDYYSSETFDDVKESKLDRLFEKYKGQLDNIYHVNDFYELASQYSSQAGFDPRSLSLCETIQDLISNARAAMDVQPWLFRKKHGRNRRDESNQMEIYQNDFVQEISVTIQEMNQTLIKYSEF